MMSALTGNSPQIINSGVHKNLNKRDPWLDIVNSTSKNDRKSNEIKKLIAAFIQKINNKDENCMMKQAGQGTVDYTFICFKEIESDDQDKIKFVLKLTKPLAGLNGRICSKALEFFGEKTPNIYTYDKSVPAQGFLRKAASQMVTGFNSQQTKNLDVAFMMAFPGSDFKDQIKTKALFKLPEEDWRRVLKSFGRVAVFDLTIGNDDRFYRPQTDAKPEDAASFCNAGNVMLSTEVSGETTRTLLDIFYIDNGSCNYFTRSSGDLSEDQLVYYNKFIEAFSTFSLRENQMKFAEVIFKGILEEFRSSDPERTNETFYDAASAHQAIAEGIQEGYQLLSGMNAENVKQIFLNYLEEVIKNNPNQDKLICEKLIELTYLCLKKLH